jgi:leader peptidase (prepilin peptidase)/N-methyltransferase
MIAFKIIAFVFGSLIGSFLNVVIHRIPLKQSVVTPRSRCPKCNHLIRWYENIPMISYLALRGKCSQCSEKISIRYPLVELLVGIFAFNLFPTDVDHNSLLFFGFYFSVACILLAHLLIDVEHQILPDKINIYFLIITIPFVVLNFNLYHWLLGGIIGFFFPLLVTWLFYKIRGQIGLGGGDIKLFGILGLILGPIGIVHNIFMSCLVGSIIGIILIVSKKLDKNKPLAFGPYIIITVALQIYYPEIFDLINPFSI